MNVNKSESITVTENVSVVLINGYDIQFDAITAPGLVASATSQTFSHTTTGPNRILFVGLFGATTDILTGITYNAIAMSFVGKVQVSTDRWVYLYVLVNPAAGAHNVVISFSGATAIKSFAVSYTGARQGNQPDASTTNSATGATSITTTVTSVINSCWTFLVAKGLSGSNPAAGAGTFLLGTGNDLSVFDSGGVITPAGSTSLIATSVSTNYATVMVAFSPSSLKISVSDSITVTESKSMSLPGLPISIFAFEGILVNEYVSPGFNIVYNSIKVFIEGIDETDVTVLTSLSVTDQISSKINTASFTIFAKDTSDFKPSAGQDVIAYDIYGNKIFGGLITNVEERRSGITAGTTSELLSYSCSCQDFTKLLQKKLVVETYENVTCAAVISDIVSRYFPIEGLTVNHVSTGPTLTQISFNYKAGDKCIDDIAAAAGFDWYVDYDRDIHFFDPTLVPSSQTFTDDTTNWTDLIIKPDRSQLRNRVYVRGGIYSSDMYLQEIESDGTALVFLLAYTPYATNDGVVGDFSVVISGNTRSVGIKDVDEVDDFDFMLNRKEKALSMGNSAWAIANSPLTSGTIIEVTYSYQIPVLTVQEDSASIAALAVLEGGDGAYEYMIIDKNITSVEAARDRAMAELEDYANPITQGSLNSYETFGIKSGQVITINSTRRGISADYLLTTVRLQVITPTIIKYNLDFTGKLYGFVDVLINLFKRTQEVLIGTDEVLDALNTFTDRTDAVSDTTPVADLGAPPYVWSNDAGSTPNKMRWSLFEWS